MWGPIVAGAAAGIATNETQRGIDKHLHEDPVRDDIFHRIAAIHKDLVTIAKHFSTIEEPPIDLLVSLQVDPLKYHLDTKGRRYNMIFVPNASTLITANIPGLGLFTFTAGNGWNELDFKSGTELYLTSGSQQNVILRLSNVPLGANVI